jgi:hypothetical protein
MDIIEPIRCAVKARGVQMPLVKVKKLDLSLRPCSITALSRRGKKDKIPVCIVNYLSKAMPFLREVDISSVDVTQSAITNFANHCHLDDSIFWIDGGLQLDYLRREDIGKRCFLFSFLRSTLQRLGIRNCSIRIFGDRANDLNPITQSMLCKMVRGLPNLVWLQSDLNAESIAMLQLERPSIVFVGSTSVAADSSIHTG